MSARRRLLARWLRQLEHVGGPEVYLSTVTPAEARAAVERFAASRSPSSRPAGPAPPSRTGAGASATARAAATGRDASAGAAVEAALAPGAIALRVLAEEAAGCVRCRLHEGRRSVVFGEGDPSADVVIVGEAPGGEEDRTGRPFVGPAGRLLDLLLLTAGFPRERVYICNILKCRPPNNRDPLPDEVAACTTTFLGPQLEAIAPRALLAVGKHAAQFLFESDAPVGRLRGRVQSWRGIPVVATYHPAYLLRSPHMARVVWEDVQLVRRIVDE